MAGSEPAVRSVRSAAPATLGSLRAIDRIVIAYAALAAVPLGYGVLRRVPGCAAGVLANAAVVLFVLLFGWRTRNAVHPLVRLARLAYGPLMFLHFYGQTATVWPTLYLAPFDRWIAALDQAVFGCQPSLALVQALRSRALSELFCLAYFGYYLYVPAVLLIVFWRRGFLAAERVVFAAALCFFSCYTFFWLFPTVGPHYFFPPHGGPALYGGYVFNHLLYFLTSRGEVPAGAFPSSHIAVAVLLTLRARRDAPSLFPVLLPVTLLLLPAVVYLRAHYVADVPTGVLVGLLFAAVSDRAYAALASRDQAQPARTGVD